jgi:hypothetical protein
MRAFLHRDAGAGAGCRLRRRATALLRCQSGIALSDVLVAMVIGLVVLGSAVTAMTGFFGPRARHDRQVQAEDVARTAIDRLASYMRSAMSVGGSSNQPIEYVSADKNDLVLLIPSSTASLTNNAKSLLHVRYCLDTSNVNNEKIYMQTSSYNSVSQASPPSTTGCASNTAWSTKTVVASNLVNQAQSPAVALFNMQTDSSGAYSDAGITAVVDADTTRTPPATKLQTSVTMRNLNHAPTAALSCQLPSSGHAICDASASQDQDGQTLSYIWYVDGTLQSSQTSYRLDVSSLSSGSHTFKVTVTDSGGLSSNQQCTTSSSCQAP